MFMVKGVCVWPGLLALSSMTEGEMMKEHGHKREAAKLTFIENPFS
jgi:hypothetical protein